MCIEAIRIVGKLLKPRTIITMVRIDVLFLNMPKIQIEPVEPRYYGVKTQDDACIVEVSNCY